MASFLAVPVDPKKNLATKSAAAPRRFSSGKANSAKQQTTRKNVAKKKVGATTNLKRTSIGNKKKMNKNSEGRQQDSGGNTTNSQGKDKPNVVFNVDKRARRINNGALFSRGIEMFRSKHPFQAKVLKEEKENAQKHFDLHRVFVRPRPLFQNEADRGEFESVSCIENGICVHEGTVKVSFRKGQIKLLRHHTFKNVTPVVSNDHMFENLKYLIDRAKNGKYSSIFMFGMTGSGKTYNTNIIHERAPKVFFESKQDISGADGAINVNQTVKVSEQSQTQVCVKVIAYELIGNKCFDLLSPSKGEVFLRVGKDKNTHVCDNVTKTATSAVELESKFSALLYPKRIKLS